MSFIVIGCNDPAVPHGATMRRDGNEVHFHCKGEDVSWTLTCNKDMRWTGGTKQCVAGKQSFFPHYHMEGHTMMDHTCRPSHTCSPVKFTYLKYDSSSYMSMALFFYQNYFPLLNQYFIVFSIHTA